jgi:hypothetical protein
LLPFSTGEFFAVFADYNQSVWPMQWALAGAAFAAVALSASRLRCRDRLINAILAFLWAWMALAYHLRAFTAVNPAAYLFTAVFLVQAGGFAWAAWTAWPLELAYRRDARTIAGMTMLGYALIGYPILSKLLGHAYPASPTFGVPCPTTIFTLGLLVQARSRKALPLLVVPVLWSFVGGSAAFLLGVWQDLGLIVAGLAAIALTGSTLRGRTS